MDTGLHDGDSAGQRRGGPPGRVCSRRDGPWGPALPPSASEINCAVCRVTQSCLTLCDPVDCSPPGSSVRGDSPGKNTGVGCHALLQGIFPTQGSNSGLPHCRWILYSLTTREALRVIRGEFCRHGEPSIGAGFPAGAPGTGRQPVVWRGWGWRPQNQHRSFPAGTWGSRL